jgi:hypothetical protein
MFSDEFKFAAISLAPTSRAEVSAVLTTIAGCSVSFTGLWAGSRLGWCSAGPRSVKGRVQLAVADTISQQFLSSIEYVVTRDLHDHRRRGLYVSDRARLAASGSGGVQFWVNRSRPMRGTRTVRKLLSAVRFRGKLAAIIAQGCLPPINCSSVCSVTANGLNR